MEEKFYCKFCDEEYDLEYKIPRIIKNCGHCICQACLKQFMEKGKSITCPIDQKEIQV